MYRGTRAGGQGLFLNHVAALLFLLFCSSRLQAEPCRQVVALLTSVQGTVEVRSNSDKSWHQVALHAPLCAGDEIRTGRLSRAQIRLEQQAAGSARDGTLMQLNERSSLVLPGTEDPWWVNLVQGVIHILSRTPQHLTVKTLFCNAKVEGTEFLVQAGGESARVSVYEGRVQVSNNLGSTPLNAGEAAIAERNQAPHRVILLKPRDAVQWALYYPPLIDTRRVPPGPQASVYRLALDQYRQNRVAAAITTLDTIPERARDPNYHELRAALLLSVGQVDEARKDLNATLTLNPNEPNALALEAVIALTQNQKDSAQAYASRASEADPNSPTAWIADSYARQAAFTLEPALHSARRAVELDPENALAWARVAELALALGNQHLADAAASHARRLDPSLARTQTISGFAALTRVDTAQARTAFSTAMQQDPADPLPRLGSGLARIREGQLSEGRRDIEDAANLDPDAALIRSYLGKAYYEEKRNDLAARELANAKALDPQDPTPWLYDAIRKQTENQPVAALHDLQQSTTLNDSRAVYRSKLALDQDLAARSSAQGRIYRDLGFEQLGLLQGWRSVLVDPTEYSGHRLLADTYSFLPRQQISRVSELLVSQLLQPINLTPVQPQLAESNLLGLRGSGPAAPAFNEFSPMFVRNQFALQASGVFGNLNTFGDEVVHSGIFDRFSYSIGQYHNETDGFRKNNDSRTDLVNGLFQLQVSPRLSAQIEIRHKELDLGDQTLYADDAFNDYVPDLRYDIVTDTYRAGARYSVDNASDMLLSYTHLERLTDRTLGGERGVSNNFGDVGEAQYLHRGHAYKTISGFGYSSSGFNNVKTPSNETLSTFASAYSYNFIDLRENLTSIIGFAFDKLDDDLVGTHDEFNPKFGLVWRLTNTSSLRLAAFRSIKRPLLVTQTIEPTQIAGFNQFFDDFTGDTYWMYGVAFDQKFSQSLYGGVEVSSRQVRIQRKTDPDYFQEQSYRAYLDWAPLPSMAARLGWKIEDFSAPPTSAERVFYPEAVIEHQGQASLRYFGTAGFIAHVDVTYVNQQTRAPSVLATGDNYFNDFALVDLGFGYRLPKRYGIIALEFKNLFDQKFNYQSYSNRQIDPDALDNGGTPFIPVRSIYTRFTLSF